METLSNVFWLGTKELRSLRSDRVLVLYDGRIIRTREGAELTEHDLISAALILPVALAAWAPTVAGLLLALSLLLHLEDG